MSKSKKHVAALKHAAQIGHNKPGHWESQYDEKAQQAVYTFKFHKLIIYIISTLREKG